MVHLYGRQKQHDRKAAYNGCVVLVVLSQNKFRSIMRKR